MGKQKLDAIIGDLRYDIAVTSQWKSVGKAVQMVLTLHPQLKYLALNKTYAVPSDFKEVCLESFPRPISFSGFEEKNGVRLLNRLTLDLTKFGENVDSLMHTLTKNFLPENFDLIAVRPGSLSQLEAFLNTHNITVDIICLDGAIRVLESARPDVFKKMKAQKYYMEVLYSPYLRCEDAAERVRILRAPNLLVPISIRHCRKFLISSGASSPQHLKVVMTNQVLSMQTKTSREPPKSALYLRLKKRNVFKIVKGDPLGCLKFQFVAKYLKNEGTLWRNTKIENFE